MLTHKLQTRCTTRLPTACQAPAAWLRARSRPVARCRPDGADQAPDLGRNATSTSDSDGMSNLVWRSHTTEAEWRLLDKKVNKYPHQRTFTAIGQGGQDFQAAILAAVESVTGAVHSECVNARPSSAGKYLSVKVTVWVHNPDQVVQVYTNIRADSRVKWYM